MQWLNHEKERDMSSPETQYAVAGSSCAEFISDPRNECAAFFTPKMLVDENGLFSKCARCVSDADCAKMTISSTSRAKRKPLDVRLLSMGIKVASAMMCAASASV